MFTSSCFILIEPDDVTAACMLLVPVPVCTEYFALGTSTDRVKRVSVRSERQVSAYRLITGPHSKAGCLRKNRDNCVSLSLSAG